MKEKPILFSGPMVRAILEGRKTQTRRVVKPQPVDMGAAPNSFKAYDFDCTPNACAVTNAFGFDTEGQMVKCPYGGPGDQLWVRETWADVNTYDGPAICYRADGSYMSWHDFSKTFGPDYGAGPSMDYDAYPGDYCMWWEDLLNGAPDHGWKPSIHMPRWASRITLEVTDVRVERLQEITEEDALAEGVTEWMKTDEFKGLAYNDPQPGARGVFAQGWDTLNAKRGYGWSENPWVWVVEFKRAISETPIPVKGQSRGTTQDGFSEKALDKSQEIL